MGLTKHCLVALLFLRAAIGGPGPSLPFGMKGKTDGRVRKENGTHNNNGMILRKDTLLSLFTLSYPPLNCPPSPRVLLIPSFGKIIPSGQLLSLILMAFVI